MKRTAIILAAAMLTGLALAGCTDASMSQGPVGVGPNINQMKSSPCACTEIPMKIPTSVG